MSIIAFIVLGLLASAIAKAPWRGDEPGGVLGTLRVGWSVRFSEALSLPAGLGGLSSPSELHAPGPNDPRPRRPNGARMPRGAQRRR